MSFYYFRIPILRWIESSLGTRQYRHQLEKQRGGRYYWVKWQNEKHFHCGAFHCFQCRYARRGAGRILPEPKLKISQKIFCETFSEKIFLPLLCDDFRVENQPHLKGVDFCYKEILLFVSLLIKNANNIRWRFILLWSVLGRRS